MTAPFAYRVTLQGLTLEDAYTISDILAERTQELREADKRWSEIERDLGIEWVGQGRSGIRATIHNQRVATVKAREALSDAIQATLDNGVL